MAKRFANFAISFIQGTIVTESVIKLTFSHLIGHLLVVFIDLGVNWALFGFFITMSGIYVPFPVYYYVIYSVLRSKAECKQTNLFASVCVCVCIAHVWSKGETRDLSFSQLLCLDHSVSE